MHFYILNVVVVLSTCCGISIDLPGNLFLDGQIREAGMDDGVDVYELFQPHCVSVISEDVCEDVIDGLHVQVHNRCSYAPRIPSRTAEDLVTCREDIVLSLIERYNYQSYLEIGCAGDDVFNLVRHKLPVSVGVDPERGGTLRMTSDEFFHLNRVTFDLIFIDGDHSAKQVMVDLEHALAVLNPGGTIVLHDCNPALEWRQFHNGGSYNGDVWKVISHLRSMPDIEVVTIDIDHGVGVVRRRANLHPLPPALQQQAGRYAHNPLEAFTYAELRANRKELLRLVSVAEFRAWLVEEYNMP
jgi:hypothetical protein